MKKLFIVLSVIITGFLSYYFVTKSFLYTSEKLSIPENYFALTEPTENNNYEIILSSSGKTSDILKSIDTEKSLIISSDTILPFGKIFNNFEKRYNRTTSISEKYKLLLDETQFFINAYNTISDANCTFSGIAQFTLVQSQLKKVIELIQSDINNFNQLQKNNLLKELTNIQSQKFKEIVKQEALCQVQLIEKEYGSSGFGKNFEESKAIIFYNYHQLLENRENPDFVIPKGFNPHSFASRKLDREYFEGWIQHNPFERIFKRERELEEKIFEYNQLLQ